MYLWSSILRLFPLVLRGEHCDAINVYLIMFGAPYKPAKKCRINDIIVLSNDFAAIVRERGVDGDVELGFIDLQVGIIKFSA